MSVAEALLELDKEVVAVQVRATDIDEETVEREHTPVVKRAVGSVFSLVRKYVPEAISSVKDYFSKRITYNLRPHHEDHVGGYFVPATDELVVNTNMRKRNPMFYVESMYHEGRHALRKALGSMENLYRGFVNEVGGFWASILYPMYEEGATSRLTQMELGRTLDGYAPYRAGAEQVERDWGTRMLIYNKKDDAKRVLPSFLKGVNTWFASNRVHIAA